MKPEQMLFPVIFFFIIIFISCSEQHNPSADNELYSTQSGWDGRKSINEQ